MIMKNILVTGAFGLVGSDLVPVLQKKFGVRMFLRSAIKQSPKDYKGQLVRGDVRQKDTLEKIITSKKITDVYHLGGLLSVGGEKNPDLAWDININGLRNMSGSGTRLQIQEFFGRVPLLHSVRQLRRK